MSESSNGTAQAGPPLETAELADAADAASTSNPHAKVELTDVSATPTETRSRRTLTARELIRISQEQPPEPIVTGLCNVGDILLLHGTEESFKSVFVVQLAESIATGKPFLRTFEIAKPRCVGIIETEMHPASIGERLAKMFHSGEPPELLKFMSPELLKEWRRANLEGKFQIIQDWIREENIEVLMIDTANDFFRGDTDPSSETDVGTMFDRLRGLRLNGTDLVRHDRKRREIDDSSHSNELIRGSAEWKEDPEVIIHLKRVDKRTNEVEMEVGKLRYGQKPEPMRLWFDSGEFRLTPLPPVISLLERGSMTRPELVDEAGRFGLSARAMDQHLDANRDFLLEGKEGHKRTFEINRPAGVGQPWYPLLAPGGVADMQS